jgi:hypothetical protein
MKKYGMALAGVFVAALFAGAMAVAQEAPAKTLKGQVVSVDAAKNMIAIKDETGADKTIQVAASTKITRGGKDITLADIKAGDRLSYLLDEGGETAPVKSISVMPGDKEKP